MDENEKIAIMDPWMAMGFNVPGWLAVQEELSAEAKLVYGAVLAATEDGELRKLEDLWQVQRLGLESIDIGKNLALLEQRELLEWTSDNEIRLLSNHPWMRACVRMMTPKELREESLRDD